MDLKTHDRGTGETACAKETGRRIFIFSEIYVEREAQKIKNTVCALSSKNLGYYGKRLSPQNNRLE